MTLLFAASPLGSQGVTLFKTAMHSSLPCNCTGLLWSLTPTGRLIDDSDINLNVLQSTRHGQFTCDECVHQNRARLLFFPRVLERL